MLTTVTPLAATPPNETAAPATNPDPVIVTEAPPEAGPDAGETEVIVGGALYVNPLVSVPDCPSGLVTTTLTVPAECAGVVAVMDEPLTTVTPVAAIPPIETVAPETNPDPVIVTDVPPTVDPEAGDMPLTVGGPP
jgi:hypothetical protein